MAEPKAPTAEVYAREAEYMQNMGEHSEAFDAILDAVPKDRQDVRDALQNIYHVEPGRLIDRDKMAKLKDQDELLFKDVNTFLTDFLERKSNLARQESHMEWLKKVAGTKVEEIEGAKTMVGLENIPLDGLVVSGIELDWEIIKQHIIPLEVAKSDDETTKTTTRKLRMIRAQLNSENAFLTLVKDDQMGGDEDWALSIINPRDLKSTEENLRSEMEVCYMTGQTVLGSSSRAALLAISGMSSI